MARFMHAHGVDCGIEGCADGRETLGYFSGDGRRRTASGHGPTLPNPEGGDTWFHGTRFGMDDEGMHGGGDYDHDDYHDDYTQDEKEGWGGGKVTGPERSAYEIGENADKHWNTDLGAHFTSLKPVARSFAGGGGLHGMTSTPSMGRVLHAGLHMSNPAVFTDEREMGAHAAKWAHKEGYRFHSPYGNAKEPVNEDHYDELRHGNYWHEGEDGELPYEHLGNYSGAHPEPAVDIDKHGVQPRHTQEHLDEYLANHPNREEITTGWKNHLKRQGHDGILYGNTLEGPHGHACAITLDDSTIHHRKWEWLNEHDRHEYDYQHGETYKPSTSGAGQWDKEWHSRDGRKPYTGSRRRVAALSPKPEYDSSLGYQENRRRESEWNTSVRRGLSLGHHTDDEARAAGYWGTGHDSDGWKPLPKDLYHVTTDVAGVHATGLKSRDELSQQHGKGLGGGESDTISFTDDPKVAEGIHDALHEFHGALNGKKTIAQMYDEAERGVGADTPYHSYFTASYPGGKDDPRLKAHIQGKEFEFGVRHESDVPHGWKPAEGHKVGDAADLQGLHVGWVRPATEDEQLRRRAACYKHYAFGRAMSGGKDDPLFFDTDLKSFAHSDPKGFGVIKAHPKPGAQGYQLGSLGEWRTATGDAVDVDKSYNHKTAIHEHVIDPFEPTERLFAPTKDHLDETLFDEQERMRPEVRKEILKVTDHFFDTHGYTGHERWARVFLAGSQASYWGGNHDFDLLIGINYPIFRQAHPELGHLSDVEVDRRFNEQLRDDFNMDGWRPSFDPHGEPWDRTGYVNHSSWVISEIKPYAAYNVTDDVWAVRPIKEPEGHKFVTTEWYYFEGVASQILAAMRLQEPARTQTLRHIWDWVHGDRSRAFGPNGTGAFDRSNALEKYLDQYPAPGGAVGYHLMDVLREAKYGKPTQHQKTASSGLSLTPTGNDFNKHITEHQVDGHGFSVPEEEGWTTKVRFQQSDHPDLNHRIWVYQEHPPAIKGFDPFRKDVGWMSYHPDTGRVEGIQTHENFARRGVATGMWNLAKQLHEQIGTVQPAHSETQTVDGKAWAEKTAVLGYGEFMEVLRGAKYGLQATASSGMKWYHGSPTRFDRFNPGGAAPDGHLSDWNTHIGPHFTSSHETARSEFAGPEGHVYSVSLDMKNPKVYESENEMSREVATHEIKRGNGLPNPPQTPEQWDDVYDEDPELYDGHGFEAAVRRNGGADDDRADYWMGSHSPEKHSQMARDYVSRLKSQGHDGIVYGNEIEGSLGHHCAIPFSPDQIKIHHVSVKNQASSDVEIVSSKYVNDDGYEHHVLHFPGSRGEAYAYPPNQERPARVAEIHWDENGEIQGMGVHPDHRRKGLATEMWQHALSAGVPIKHSPRRSDSGDAWARSVGGDLPDRTERSVGTFFDAATGKHYSKRAGGLQATAKVSREAVGQEFERAYQRPLSPFAQIGAEDRLPVEHIFKHPQIAEHPATYTLVNNYGSSVHHVRTDALRPTQPHLDEKYLYDKDEREEGSWDEHPGAIKDASGRYRLVDGHHRVARALLNGQKTIPVRVWDVKKCFGHLASSRVAMAAADDDWRMQHRPPGRDGIPLHDMTVNLPDDVYTHPHYYADMTDPSTQDSVSVMRRVRGRPDAKVKVYRALPAEHAHKGIGPGDWVTTSKEYARIHGRQSDPKHDWPVISATVRAGDLHTDGDDFREYGYNGDKSMPGNIAHKGGYHQEVSKKADGTISPVVRRSQSPVKGYDVRHDPQEFDDYIAGRGGITARDPQGNYAGHMRWDEDGVFSQNVHEDHQHVADHLIRKMRQQVPKIHRQAALSGNGWEISRKRVPTGGSKFGERYELSAVDSDGKRQGWVRYHEPKRKGSPMHVEEVRGDVPGVASHLLNHMESLHPNASRTVFLGDNIKRDKNTPKHTTGDHGKPTDWDQHYDSIGELHRGFVIRMDPYDARKVNSADRAPEDHVKTLLSQIGGGRAGTHWTSGLRESQNFSQRNQSDPRTDIPVILHAQKPERKDIETRPSELFRHGVFPYDHVEKEVPIRKGRDVVLTGMSWKPDVAHPEADEQGWLHHTFDQPITKRAHSDGPSTVEDDPARWGVGGWRDRDMSQSKLRETHTGSDGYTYHHAPGSLNGDDEGYGSIYVTHGDDPHNVVGESYYGPHSSLPERLELASRVAPDHRRRGVATGMYDFAERLTGKQTAPADSHSDQAAAFWSHRRASRGSVTINYLHNTERAPHPGDTYGQDIEPHGRYLIEGYQGRTASAGDVQYISHQELRNMYSGDYDAPMGKAHGSMLRDWRDYKNGELDEDDIHSGEREHGGPAAHIRHLQNDIAQNGLKEPLTIRGGNVVVDGNHRGVAALNLRLDKIPVRHVAGLQQKSARLVLSATDDEWRMQHRPPGAEDGIPLHDMTHNLPDDVYTHPHYYADMSEPSVQDSVSVMRRVRGRPDAKVKIYRALPAEHAHKGIGPGDWVTTSREYARIHGRQADPKHDWPIISASVRAGDLHTDGDDFREYGYNGEHRLSGNVSYKGGYHQEVSQRADGTIKPVVRKAQSPVKDYTITHDPHSYEDFLSARGGVTIKDPKGNYAGHMRWDRDGVYSQDVHEDHQHLAEHLIRKMKRQVPKGIPSEITKKEASMAGTSTYPYDLRVAMPWFNNDDGVDPSKAKSVRDAGYAGYVGDSERDEELGHGGYGGHEDEFDDDLWDHVAPHPTHEEKRHMDEHGEYPDSYHERHDEAYGEAQHRKAQEDEMDHDDPDLHHFIGEHGSNSALWKEKGTFGKINIKDQPVYATQSHVNQQHIDHYTASPGDISHSMRNTPGYGQRHAQDPYLADEHPMFVTHEGRLHVTDGHHRVAAALQSGQKHIMGWHYDGDKHGFPDEDEGGWGHHTSSRVQRRPELLSLSAYAKLVLVAEDEETHTREGVTHAGLIVKANDTGRVVVLQRSYKDEEDPARGMLEFPGGGIEPGESAYQAACREWQEETGAHLPEGDPSGSFISNGLYKGFIMVVPSEDDVDIHEAAVHSNPDDPFRLDPEVVMWIDIEHLADGPATRSEVKSGTDWDMLREAAL